MWEIVRLQRWKESGGWSKCKINTLAPDSGGEASREGRSPNSLQRRISRWGWTREHAPGVLFSAE